MSDISDAIKDTAMGMVKAGVMTEAAYKELVEDIDRDNKKVLEHGATLEKKDCSGCPNRARCKNVE